MATLEEIFQAAKKADMAGDTAGAAKLVGIARSMMGQGATQPISAPQNRPTYAEDLTPATPPPYDQQGKPTQPVDRFGDTISAAMEQPVAALSAFAGGLADQSKSPTMAALPKGIPYTMRRTIAGVGDLGGLALSGLGTVYAGAAGLAGEAFGGSPTRENQLARDLMMMGQVAVPELAGVSGTTLAAGRAATVAPKALSETQQFRNAARDIGVVPSLGMTSKAGAMAASAMEKVPFSANAIAKDAARAVGEVEGAFNAAVPRIGTAGSPMVAGERLQAGLGRYVESFQARSKELFDKVDARIPPDTQVALPETIKTIDASKKFFENNPELAQKLGLNQWDKVVNEAAANGIPWQGVKQFRTEIGKAIGSNRGTLADEDLGRLKSLYGALTADMENATRQTGNGAYGAWKAATGYYQKGATRIEIYLDKTIKADSPERAFEAFRNMASKDRSSSDIQRMRVIKSSMPPDDWNAVSASIVDRLGKASSGQQSAAGDKFSASTFLTEWNKMSPEAKAVLLPDDIRSELDSIAKVSERVKSANAERNSSNTGTTTAWTAIGAGLATSPKTTVATLLANAVTAKALTSLTFLKAVNQASKGQRASLSMMATGDGPFKADAQAILSIIAANEAQPPQTRAFGR